MQVSRPETSPNYYQLAGNLRTGTRDVRVLLNGKEGALNNFRLSYGGGEGNGDWSTPRHHHNFEQLRYPLSGDYVIGKNDVLPAGWIGYFPESAYYGPQVMSPNLEMFTLQFGGPSGNGFASTRQRRKGYDDLIAKGGKFENGAYTWVDKDGKKHNQDAYEAVWEQMNQRKINYPPPRYRDLILMNPASFDWVKDDTQPGVAWKITGDFTERHIRVGHIQMEAGATLKFGAEKAPETLAVLDGAISFQGETYKRLAAFGVDDDEAPITLKALDATLLYYIKLPTF